MHSTIPPVHHTEFDLNGRGMFGRAYIQMDRHTDMKLIVDFYFLKLNYAFSNGRRIKFSGSVFFSPLTLTDTPTYVTVH